MPETGDGTRCVHGGHTAAGRPGEPLHPGPVMSSTFHLGPPDEPFPTTSTAAPATRPGRAGGGDRRARRRRVRHVRLRHGRGRRRTAAHRPGRRRDRAAVGRLLRHPRPRPRRARPARGRVREVPTAGPVARRVLDGATLLLVETPSNPGLDVCDLRAAAAAAHAAGALLAVDNTTATPLGQRPLELGADLTVASDTKALSGPRRRAARPRQRRGPRAGRAAARGPHPHRRPPRPDGGLARPPRARHARPAPRPPGRQRRGARPRLARAPGRRPTSAGPGCPTTRHTPSPPRRCAGGTGCCGSPCPRWTPWADSSPPRGSPLGHQLRRPAQQRRPPAALGRRGAPGLVRFSAGCEDTADLVADVVTALDTA